ncbi:MAG: LysR family transcriptional regulator [Blastocatellia bacterium]|nr:LysR family transcriptional regulator [Blastocatellia bacterium]
MSDSYSCILFTFFRIVAKAGSVTRAANELFISQPAVSAHLKAVEKRFGETLFERTPRGVSLTTIGREVLEQVNRLFALYNELPGVVDAARGQIRGEVAVAASSTPGAYCIPVLLKQFQEQYREAKVNLLVGDTAEVLQWLHDYRVPLGVVGELHAEEDFHKFKIGCDELSLVTSAENPILTIKNLKPEDVRGQTLFIRERGSSTREATEKLLGDLLQSFGRIVEISNPEAIKQSVIAGLGVAVLSSWSIELERKAGLLSLIGDDGYRMCRNFYLVKRQNRILTGSAAALWDSLKECCAIHN